MYRVIEDTRYFFDVTVDGMESIDYYNVVDANGKVFKSYRFENAAREVADQLNRGVFKNDPSEI